VPKLPQNTSGDKDRRRRRISCHPSPRSASPSRPHVPLCGVSAEQNATIAALQHESEHYFGKPTMLRYYSLQPS